MVKMSSLFSNVKLTKLDTRGTSHLIVPIIAVLTVGLVGVYVLSQTHAATPKTISVICDGGAPSSKEGPYCLDDDNASLNVGIYTRDNAGVTACFKADDVGLVKNVSYSFTNASIKKAYGDSEMVHIQSCGPRGGYLYPTRAGQATIYLSGTAGNAEEWMELKDPSNPKAMAFINVRNTNDSQDGAVAYILQVTKNYNGTKTTPDGQAQTVKASGTLSELAVWNTSSYTL